MKERPNLNPMRWFVYIAVFWLVFTVFQICVDRTISRVERVWGITFVSSGPLNPLAPFRIICIVLFLYFYFKQSRFAWYIMFILLLLGTPAYWILRSQGIYFRPPNYTALSDLFSLAVYAGFIFWIIKIRVRYLSFLSSKDDGESGASEN